MGRSSSPQRRRWITEPEEIEPVPGAFGIIPQYDEKGVLIAFTVEDPEADVIRKRGELIAKIHEEYPGVSLHELNDASIAYFDYRATVVLKR